MCIDIYVCSVCVYRHTHIYVHVFTKLLEGIIGYLYGKYKVFSEFRHISLIGREMRIGTRGGFRKER